MSGIAWSVSLAIVGISSAILTGRKMKLGWAITFFAQFLWIAFAADTGQYGFILLSCVFLVIAARNWLAWRQDEQIDKSSVHEETS